jgi:hypothetical protein
VANHNLYGTIISCPKQDLQVWCIHFTTSLFFNFLQVDSLAGCFKTIVDLKNQWCSGIKSALYSYGFTAFFVAFIYHHFNYHQLIASGHSVPNQSSIKQID